MATVTAIVDGGRIKVRSPFECAPVAKSVVGGLWKKPFWTYPATPLSARSIFEAYTGAGHEIDADRDFVVKLVEAAKAVEARAAKTADDLDDFPGKVSAWLHQRRAYHFAQSQAAAAIVVGMGGGKTKLAIGLFEGREAKKVLILCPNNVVGVWPKEFAIHAESEWRVANGTVIGRGGKPKKNTSVAERAASIKSALERSGRVCVVVNYESAWRPAMADLLLSQEWDTIALDESHKIKAPGGRASKFCDRLRDKAGHRLALTGTLQPHSPLDVYAQYRFLDPAIFGTSFAKFRNRYAVMGGYEGREIIGWQRQDELAEKIGHLAFIIEQEELDAALDLPEQIDIEKTTRLSSAGQRAYDVLWGECVEKSDAGTVVVDNVLTKYLRVQQVTSGHLPYEADDGTVTVKAIDDSKKKLLADTLDDLPKSEPVVVFARFTHDLDNVREVAESQGRRYGELSGRDKGGLTDAATMNPDVDVLGVQIQAGGVGIDLSRSAYAIYYSLGFNLGDYLQSRKRVHRPGQTRATKYVHLIATDTIDEIVYQALRDREDLVSAVLRAAKGE